MEGLTAINFEDVLGIPRFSNTKVVEAIENALKSRELTENYNPNHLIALAQSPKLRYINPAVAAHALAVTSEYDSDPTRSLQDLDEDEETPRAVKVFAGKIKLQTTLYFSHHKGEKTEIKYKRIFDNIARICALIFQLLEGNPEYNKEVYRDYEDYSDSE
uniref:Uncharacterized protein n=1 Tax=viral metagenome TaxID=1070528 RepID=A0A6C0JUW0_9ZZZZ